MPRALIAALAFVAALAGAAAPARASTLGVLAGDGFPGMADAAGAKAQFRRPVGVAVDAEGNVYVADRDNYRIRKVDEKGNVTTFVGTGDYGDQDSAFTVSPHFKAVEDVAIDKAGNLYVADGGNQIRKVTPQGAVSTVLSKDLNHPQGLACDAAGNVFVADTDNNVIKKIDPTGAASVLAGDGNAGYNDGAGKDARFLAPEGVAVDAKGIVYVADTGNHRIRQIDDKGNVTTVTTNAKLERPSRLVVDKNDTLYISDVDQDAIVVIAANGASQEMGLSAYAWPGGLAFDPKTGALVFAVAGKHQVWRLAP